MIFRLACPNVAFVANYDATNKRSAMSRLESVGFIFRPDGSGFVKCSDVLERDLSSLDDLLALQEQAGVTLTLDGPNLIFEQP